MKQPAVKLPPIVAVDHWPEPHALLVRIKEQLPALEALLTQCSGHSGYEDPIYRFYHHSFKVYHAQETTEAIVSQLQALAPDRPLNSDFLDIVKRGTGKVWSWDTSALIEVNKHWSETTAPIVEAFLHARYFLEMAVKYGKELSQAPMPMPSGWAALLALYAFGYNEPAKHKADVNVCAYCGHRWRGRVPSPARCPYCRSSRWRQPARRGSAEHATEVMRTMTTRLKLHERRTKESVSRNAT